MFDIKPWKKPWKQDYPTNSKVIGMSFKLFDAPELYDALNKHRIKKNITWTKFWLLGAAYLVDRDGDNPDLVVEIANYISSRR